MCYKLVSEPHRQIQIFIKFTARDPKLDPNHPKLDPKHRQIQIFIKFRQTCLTLIRSSTWVWMEESYDPPAKSRGGKG